MNIKSRQVKTIETWLVKMLVSASEKDKETEVFKNIRKARLYISEVAQKVSF